MKIGANIGSGKCHLKSTDTVQWINIDHEESHNPDVCMDCLKLHEVYGDNHFDSLITQHMIEHLIYPTGVIDFIKQCYRVLKPRGTLRIVVPDLMKVSKKYVAGEDLKDVYGADYKGYYYKDCAAERMTYFCRAWQHLALFDAELLTSLIEDTGFKNIEIMPLNMSRVKEMCGVDRFASESLVCECTK